jgi:hypothetical protein
LKGKGWPLKSQSARCELSHTLVLQALLAVVFIFCVFLPLRQSSNFHTFHIKNFPWRPFTKIRHHLMRYYLVMAGTKMKENLMD